MKVPAFDLSKKKKKKKPSAPKAEDVAEEVEKLSVEDKTEEEKPEEPEPSADLGEFSGKKKKKSSKKSVKINDQEDVAPQEDEAAPVAEGQVPWAGSDRDYTYEELAGRIYSLLHSNNPEFIAKQKRYVMKPPQVNRVGTKKTAWLNFVEICTILRRDREHFLNYVLTELGTNGSIDGSYSLIIKGRFQPKQIENVIRHYISEYVACRTCKSPETILKKENRLYFLCCQSCGATRSVSAIKKGFEAQVGKRKKEEK